VVVLLTLITFPSIWNIVGDLDNGRMGGLCGVGGSNRGVHVVVFDMSRCFLIVLRCALTHLSQFSAQSLATETSGNRGGVCILNCICMI
jgi:hypothetical protein